MLLNSTCITRRQSLCFWLLGYAIPPAESGDQEIGCHKGHNWRASCTCSTDSVASHSQDHYWTCQAESCAHTTSCLPARCTRYHPLRNDDSNGKLPNVQVFSPMPFSSRAFALSMWNTWKEWKSRKEKTTPFGVNLMRSQVLYWAAQRCKTLDD